MYAVRASALGLAILSSPFAVAQPAPASAAATKTTATAATDQVAGIDDRTVQLERRIDAAEQRAINAEKVASDAQARSKQVETKATESEAKLQELATQLAESEANAQATQEAVDEIAAHAAEVEPLRFYGFADMGWRVIRADSGTAMRNLIDAPNQFVLGNANLYLDAQPTSNFRVLTELRFSTYPGGSYAGQQAVSPTNTTIMDTNSPTGRNRVQWSGIILERAQLEYKQSDALALTVGYFLTPYGIWNVDHGSPTLISLALPTFFASEFFPTHSLGVQLAGSTVTEDVEIGYRAYVTNGRSPVQGDIDKNKSLVT